MTDNGLLHRGYHLERCADLFDAMEAAATGITAIFAKEFYADDAEKELKYLIRIRKYRANPFAYEGVIIWKDKNCPERMVSTSFCDVWTADELERFAEEFYQKMTGMVGAEVKTDATS